MCLPPKAPAQAPGGAVAAVPPPIDVLRAAVKESGAFERRPLVSLAYMCRDLGLMAACFWLAATAMRLGAPAAVLVLPVHGLAGGFIMWCCFVVGHDCGHGSFSSSALLNGVCGHLCHAVLCVPYWPWAFSHHQHHLYHNHKTKDLSHPWFEEEEFMALAPWMRFSMTNYLAPFYMFPAYLLMEAMDGCHFWPWSKMYDGASVRDRVQCAVSSVAVVAFVCAGIKVAGGAAAFATLYLPPYLMFSWWLYAVTYLQHHEKGTKVYTDGDWSYLKGAVETVDRTFGMGIDAFHHHITDGHVAHHIFFREIPHYKLPAATAAVKKVLEPLGLYKWVDTRDFVLRTHDYTNKLGGIIPRLAKTD